MAVILNITSIVFNIVMKRFYWAYILFLLENVCDCGGHFLFKHRTPPPPQGSYFSPAYLSRHLCTKFEQKHC